MKIEVLSFAGCPNRAPTLELVRRLVAEDRIQADITEVHVQTPEEAAALRFLGSPSVRVDGLDVEPAARALTAFGFGCRTYSEDGLRAGLPSPAMIRAAIRESAS